MTHNGINQEDTKLSEAEFQALESQLNIKHFEITEKTARQTRWLVFAIVIIAGTICFSIYNSYLSNLSVYADIDINKHNMEKVVESIADLDRPEVDDWIFESITNYDFDLKDHDTIAGDLDEFKEGVAKLALEGNDNVLKDILKQVKQDGRKKDLIRKLLLLQMPLDRSGSRKLSQDSMLVEVPLMGFKILMNDYTILLAFLGLVFIFWLNIMFNYVFRILRDYLNNSKARTSSEIIARLFPINFSLLWPSDHANYNSHNLMRILMFFIVSVGLVLATDYYDVFVKRQLFGLTAYQIKPIFSSLLPHIIFKTCILSVVIVFSVILTLRLNAVVKHASNVLLLLRWDMEAAFPALYESELLFNDEIPIRKQYRNWITYVGKRKEYKLHILLAVKNQRTGEEYEYKISEEVNFWKTYPRFMRKEDDYFEKESAKVTRYFKEVFRPGNKIEPALGDTILAQVVRRKE